MPLPPSDGVVTVRPFTSADRRAVLDRLRDDAFPTSVLYGVALSGG